MRRKVTSVLLSLVLALTSVDITAFAVEQNTKESITEETQQTEKTSEENEETENEDSLEESADVEDGEGNNKEDNEENEGNTGVEDSDDDSIRDETFDSEVGEEDKNIGETEENGEVNNDNDNLLGDAEERLALMTSSDDIASGAYGNIAWVIDANGKLMVEGTGEISSSTMRNDRAPWWTNRESIISAQISVTNIKDASYMFANCINMKSIDLSEFDTSEVIDMTDMFSWCSSLVALDLRSFDTGNVTNMCGMFNRCEMLVSLDLRSFNTSNVTNMAYMFDGCEMLENLNLRNFDTSKVTDMSDMFWACDSLTSLDLKSFNTSQVTNMSGMFACDLTSLDLSNFDTSKVTNMVSMFYGNSKLKSIDLSNFDTRNVTNMSSMFRWCSSLTDLNISSFNTSNVTAMSGMFYGCVKLKSIDLSNFDTSNVVDMNGMFFECVSLESLDLSNFNTSKVTDMSGMFFGGYRTLDDPSSLRSLNLSSFDTSNVKDMSEMFENCSSLTSLNISNFNTSSVKNMSEMFSYCENLTSLDVSNFDTGSVTNMSRMFSYCSSLTDLDVSNFDTSSVTDMSWMFSICNSLQTLDISNFDTSCVTDMLGMFSGCYRLASLDVSNFDTSSVSDMGFMFSSCYRLASLDVSKFDTSSVSSMRSMFSGCSSLTNLDVSNFDTESVMDMQYMFSNCRNLVSLDLSSFNMVNVTNADGMLNIEIYNSSDNIVLSTIYTPYNISVDIELPVQSGDTWHRSDGSTVTVLPQNLSYSVALGKNYIPEEKAPETAIIKLKDGECAILVYDEYNQLPIEGAAVIIDGTSYTTDSEGLVRFAAYDGSEKKQIIVNAYGYNEVDTYQYIENKSLIRIGMELSDEILQIISVSASLGSEDYDLLRKKLVLGYAKDFDDFSNVTESTLNLTIKSTKNNVRYEILSASGYMPGIGVGIGFNEKVLFTSNDGKFSIDVATEIVKVGDVEIARTAVTNLIEPGQRMLVRATDEDGKSILKMLNVSSTYNYLTQENTSQKDQFKLGDEMRISVPDEVPFIGGNDYVFGFEDKMPVEVEIDEDGKVKISYNKPADIDMDKFCKEYKNLEKKANFKAANIAGNTSFGAGMIKVSGKVCGYGEGNISEIMNGNPDIKLGIMAEIVGEAGYKHYWVIGFIPVKLFVEGKATGSVSFEAGMKFENWKIKEFDISGGSFNLTLQLEVGGGIGFGYEVEASLVGKINYANKPARQYERLWLEASGKVKRIIIGMWEKIFWESDTYEYTLYQKGKDTPRSYTYDLMADTDNEKGTSELSLMSRTYLNYTEGYNASANTMGIMAYDSTRTNANSIVKPAVLPSASPTLLETDSGKYLFWIDDIASRDEYNRTALMYAKSVDGVNWSTPVQLLAESEDNTLDGSYDVFADGSKIYLVWQDASRQLTEDDDVLDVLKSLSVRYAVLDTAEDTVTENECLTQESGYYMYPSIVAAGDEAYFAYVHNMLDTDDIDGNNKQHLYVMTKDSTAREVAIPDNAQIVNMDAGIFEGRAGLVCEMDTDGDASTDEDREIYIYDIQSDNLTRITNNGVVDTMPVIADSGNIYWFQNTDIVELSATGGTPKAIWDEPQMAYQTVFTVATDASGKDTILWESVDKEAEDGSVAIFQTSENSDGTWGNVVKFAKTTGTISSKISAAGSGDSLQVAHTEGIYLEDGTALKDLCVTTRENVADIAVEYVDFDEESAAAGNPLVLKTEVVNNGNTTVDEVTVSVNDTAITTLTGLNLKPSESRELDISGFSVPSSLKESTYFTLKLTAAGENNQEDNIVDFLLGCPDVYVETDSRIAGERTWLDVSIWNNTTYEASGEVLVHKSTEDGEVIYRKAYNGLDANSGYAYSVDLGDYEDKNVKYYVEVTADNEENSLGNNTEFVYIGYGTGIEEENDNKDIQEVNSISLNVKDLSLGVGETSQLIAKDDQGNAFSQGELLWSSSDNRIASVNQTGLVKAHRLGRAEITVYYGDLSYSCSVTVGEESETQTLTVWFDTQGGDEIAPITGIAPGSTITLPTNVRKSGYIFDGWYTQPTGGEKIDGSILFVEHSITLYAHWISEQSETGMWVEDIADQIYIGKAIKPQVKVYDGTTLLREKTDYTVSYKNNINANDASNAKTAPTVIVTGKGNYSGKETITFRILPIDLNDTSVITSDITVAYNKKIQKKVPTLTYNGKKLSNNKDFTVSYPDEGVDAYKAANTYNIVLTAKEGGNFTGTRTVKLIITNNTLISKATVRKIPDQTYTGSEIEPELTVTYKKTPLVKDRDYTVAYTNNTATGTATATLTGIGEYTGTKDITFKITGYPLKKAKVTGIENKVYNGSSQEQQIAVTYNNVQLTEGKDYNVVYSNNKDVGKANITINGINAYSGTIKKSFKITAYDLQYDSEKQLEGFENELTAKYVKGGAKPTLNLKFAGNDLTEGADYTVSCKNNKAVTAGTQKQPTITIKGKGNFKGKLSATFTIVNKALNDEESPVTLTVADKGYVDKAGKYMSKPILTDADGKKLVAGKDYEKEIVYSLEDGTFLTNESKVNAGTIINIKVTGKGAYYGELETTYRITEYDFSKAKISIKPQIYSGDFITLGEDEITVKIGKSTLLYGTDYEIVEGSYKNNKYKGTASVVIVGKGNYGGMKTSKFKITTKGLKWFWRMF